MSTAQATPDSTSDTDDRATNDRVPAITDTMRAAVARQYGQADQIEIAEVPVPQPGPGELLVAVGASSLNALDWHFLTGTPYLIRMMHGVRRPKRIIHGADVAGTVVALGDDVERFAVGDRVFGESVDGGGGGFAPYLTIDADHVAAIPDGVGLEDAAATPVAGLTALQGLQTHGRVQPGDEVLINGAAGGVGTFAVQIAVALGARVTAVCSGRNVAMVRALGADRVIDYEQEDLLTSGLTFDVVMDNVGNHPPKAVRALLRSGARLVLISGPKRNRWVDPLPHVVRTALGAKLAGVEFHQFTASANHADLTRLGEMLTSGALVPQIDRVVGLDGVAEGFAEIGSGHARAKIVVHPNA